MDAWLDPPKAPSVFPLIPSGPTRVARATSADSKVIIGCLVKGYFPAPAKVQWNSGAITSGIQEFHPVQHASGQYTHTSLLTIPTDQWTSSTSFYCNVEHEATNTSINQYVGRTSRHFSTRIDSYLLPPRPKHLYIHRNAKITCMVVNLEWEVGLKISWSREKQVAMHPELVAVSKENNGTFTAVSRLPISAQDWESGETFTCSVEYPGLPGPIVKTISKNRETSKAPIVHVYPPIPGNSLIITCLVTGFAPIDINTYWLKDGQAISENDYVNTPAVKEKNGDSNFMYSKLSIPKSSWDHGDIYSCEVVHEALETKVTRKSIKKTLETTVSIENNYSTKKEEEMNNLWVTVVLFYIFFLISVCYGAIITLFKVKWVALALKMLKKKPIGPRYKNIIQQRI